MEFENGIQIGNMFWVFRASKFVFTIECFRHRGRSYVRQKGREGSQKSLGFLTRGGTIRSSGGHSQTTFTAIGGGGVREMSTLFNKFGKFH